MGVNSRSTTAAIVSSVARKTGGCRTTGSVVRYDGVHQTFGEPLERLGFTALPSHTGSYQDKTVFDTFDKAWQGCAKQCNWDHKCHTYTVRISVMGRGTTGTPVYTTCFQHDPYTSDFQIKEKRLQIDGGPNSDEQEYTSYHVSGVCRTNEK